MNSEATPSYPPMLLQYLEYKEKHPDCLLLCQVGDFYEIFFEDAVTVSRTLNLTLTSRDKSNPNPVPMCGVPVSVVDLYVDRLVSAGFSVAMVSQTDEVIPNRGGVARALDRIITPGVRILGGASADAKPAIALAIYADSENDFSVAFCDVQWGMAYVREGFTQDELYGELARISPTEIVICKATAEKDLDRRIAWVRDLEQRMSMPIKFRGDTYIEDNWFDLITGMSVLTAGGRKAARLLLNYIDETTVDVRACISEVVRKSYHDVVAIDATTRRNLDLIKSSRDGTSRGSLFSVLNATNTIEGSKLLAQWISNPLTEQTAIEERHKALRLLLGVPSVRNSIISLLAGSAEPERIAARIAMGVAGPRELGALRDFLRKVPLLKNIIVEACQVDSLHFSDLLMRISDALESPEGIEPSLAHFLVDSPPLSMNDGGIIREGYNEELDKLRTLRDSGKSWIIEFELGERKRSGISTLKVKYNHVLGYFIEVTSSNVHKVPTDYVRRQSTANSERYFLPTLKEMEEQVMGAQGRQIALERTLFEEFRATLTPFIKDIRALSAQVAFLDVLVGLAEVAERERYVQPEFIEEANITIRDGRHPVLAEMLQNRFVPNSVSFTEEVKFFILTGPNMGGKSTFLRQIGLISIMAQMGSFVPATSAQLGIVDKVFARIGASDDMLEGDSTFMVEMREASFILSEATDRSLVLIDEIGRGTATADGLAIAHAIVEWMVNNIKCRTLFATHFHELTELTAENLAIGNLSVGSIERGEDVIFTHEIKNGPANRSYGIEVAKLAGLPKPLLDRARAFLTETSTQKAGSVPTQPKLFESKPLKAKIEMDVAVPEAEVREVVSEKFLRLESELQKISVESTTPLEALRLLETFQKLIV